MTADGGDGRTARVAVERDVAARLRAAGVPSPEVDARWLVDHVVEVTGDPTGCGGALLDGLVARRAAREPLQVVVGRTWFRTLELVCAPGVFIPRPETEVVAGVAIDVAAAAARPRGFADWRPGPAPAGGRAGADAPAMPEGRVRVVDVCTGTGAIACAIAAEVSGVEVVATDLSTDAVALARENAARLAAGRAGDVGPAAGSSIEVVAGDLLDGVDPSWRGQLDVLVANPPYLPAADRASWEPEVAEHDPDVALVGGDDGHEIVDRLLRLAMAWLRPGGAVVVEIDDRRGADARAAAVAAGLVDVRVVPDLTGRDRAVVARRPVG